MKDKVNKFVILIKDSAHLNNKTKEELSLDTRPWPIGLKILWITLKNKAKLLSITSTPALISTI